MAHSAGIKVVIHPQGIMPFPDEEGISISPGELTQIGLTQVRNYYTIMNLKHLLAITVLWYIVIATQLLVLVK